MLFAFENSSAYPYHLDRLIALNTAKPMARAVKAPRGETSLSQAKQHREAEHGGADLRRTTADVWRRELVHGQDVLRGTTLPAILVGTRRRRNRRGAQSAPAGAAVHSCRRCCGAALPLSESSLPDSVVLGRSAGDSSSHLFRSPCRDTDLACRIHKRPRRSRGIAAARCRCS